MWQYDSHMSEYKHMCILTRDIYIQKFSNIWMKIKIKKFDSRVRLSLSLNYLYIPCLVNPVCMYSSHVFLRFWVQCWNNLIWAREMFLDMSYSLSLTMVTLHTWVGISLLPLVSMVLSELHEGILSYELTLKVASCFSAGFRNNTYVSF